MNTFTGRLRRYMRRRQRPKDDINYSRLLADNDPEKGLHSGVTIEMVSMGTRLLDLSDELIRKVLLNLSTDDVLAIQGTGNKRLVRIVAELNHHMRMKFQVALWRMQRRININDAKQFQQVPWPTHIIDLFVFHPIFADGRRFVRNLLTIYCPLAALFAQTPPMQASCFQLIERAYAIALDAELKPTMIVEFVNVTYAALEKLKQMMNGEFIEIPKNVSIAINMLWYLYREPDYPNIMDYVAYLDNVHGSSWLHGNVLDSDASCFIRQAIGRSLMFEGIMQNIESISLTCVSLKYITGGLLYRLPKVCKLKLELGTTHDVGPIISHLAATNRITTLCLYGQLCDGMELLEPELFLPLRKYTALHTLWFCYSDFLTNRILRSVLANVQNVHTFGSLYNQAITTRGMMRALKRQKKIHTLDINFRKIRVMHTPVVSRQEMRKYCIIAIALCAYILFIMLVHYIGHYA